MEVPEYNVESSTQSMVSLKSSAPSTSYSKSLTRSSRHTKSVDLVVIQARRIVPRSQSNSIEVVNSTLLTFYAGIQCKMCADQFVSKQCEQYFYIYVVCLLLFLFSIWYIIHTGLKKISLYALKELFLLYSQIIVYYIYIIQTVSLNK